MNKQMSVLAAFFAVLLAGGLTGCSGYNHTAKTQNYQTNQYTGEVKQNSYAQRTNTVREDEQRVAKRVAQQAANVNGVTRATAVVHGEDVLVGVEGATASNMKMMERSVYEALHRSEPGYRIHVTADRTLSNRIRMLSHDINVGVGNKMRQAGSDITNLIRDISGSVTAPFR